MGLLLDIQQKLPLQLAGLSRLSQLSAQQKRRQLQQPDTAQWQLMGHWCDSRAGQHEELKLYRQQQQWLRETCFDDGCHCVDILQVQATDEGLRLEEQDGNMFGDYLLLAENGDLAFCDADGRCALAEKMPA